MNTTTEEKYLVAKEIFSQLKASTVNRFPFFAYSGIKPEYSENDLSLHCPKNPGKIYRVDISLNEMDTYDLKFFGKINEVVSDIYCDMLADVIIRKMEIL